MEGKILFRKYETERLLGEGTFGKVYKARSLETGETVAIKVINKELVNKLSMEKQIKREISTMSLLKHPNIVEIKEVMASKTHIYLVMEYLGGGDLYTSILQQGKLNENLARKYFHQLIRAVDFCHSRGVCHRDLKLENILLDNNKETLKLCDFGLATLPGQEQGKADGLLCTPCGAFAYMAPEIIRGDKYDGKKADIWSCGVILYSLVAGFPPFQDENRMRMLWKIRIAKYEFPPWFSREIKQLIGKILVSVPWERITMEGIIDSPWFHRHEYERDHNPFEPSLSSNSVEVGLPCFSSVSFNAFDFILSMASGLDLSGLFGTQKGKLSSTFVSKCPMMEVTKAVERMAERLKLLVRGGKGSKRLVLVEEKVGRKGRLVVGVSVFEVAPEVNVVEFSRWAGDSVEYMKLMEEEVRPAVEGVAWKWQGDWVHGRGSEVGSGTCHGICFCI